MQGKTLVSSSLTPWLLVAALSAVFGLGVPGTAGASGETVDLDAFDLPPGASVTIEFEVEIDDPPMNPPSDTEVCNQGFASIDGNGSFPSNDPDTAPVDDPTCTGVLLQADLSITKTDGAATEVPGTPVTYTITAMNAGPSQVFGATVADTFPASLSGCNWTCSGTGTCTANGSGNINDSVNLAVGQSVTYSATCNIAPSATGTLVNTATIMPPMGVQDPMPGNNSATDSDTLTPQVDVAITKTDGAASEIPGTPVTYTITATNSGPSSAPGTTIADTFPASLSGCTWTCVGAGGGTCTANGSGNIGDTANLPPSGSVTYLATCNIDPAATGTLVNTATATVAGGITDTNTGNNSSTDTDTLTPQANLVITKTDGATTEVPGTPVTYTIAASNTGPSNAPGSTVADTFPASLSGCTWTCTGASGGTCTANGSGNINDTVNLPASGSVTYTATCNIDPAATGSLVNTATVIAAGGVTDPTPGDNSATDTDTLTPQVDLSITKTDGAATEIPGTPVTYTITVNNSGPSSATGSTVTDNFPGSLSGCTWTCTGAGGGTCTANGSDNIGDTANVPNGGSVTYTATCNIGSGATGTLVNTATVAAAGGVTDTNGGNNSATDTDTLTPEVDVSISKDDGAATEIPGTEVEYDIVVTNPGPSDAPSVTVADTFPTPPLSNCTWTCSGTNGATCSANGTGNINDVANLPDGSSVTYVATCDIDAGSTGTLTNTATATVGGGVTDTNTSNNTDDDVDQLLDLDLGDAPDTSIDPGFLYPTVLADDGAHHAESSLFLGALLDTETEGQPSLAADGDDQATNPPTVVDDEDGVIFTEPLVACTAADLTVTASGAGLLDAWIDWDADGEWDSGEKVFTDEALVAGPNSLSVNVPCTIVPGFSYARFRLSSTGGLSFTGLALDGEVEDYRVTLVGVADLSITKTDGVTTAVPGGGVTYTITAMNDGSSPTPVVDATIADTFPATLSCTWTCTGAGGGTCTANGVGNINDLVDLPVGGSVTYTAICSIAANATGTLVNTATITAPANIQDSNPANNSATDTDTLTPMVDVQVTKTDGATEEIPGTPVTYTIAVSNPGPSDAPGTAVADTFPASLSGCTWTCTGAGGGTCTANGSGSITDTVNLPAGSSVSYTATCNIDPAATGNLVNTATATVAGGITDSNPANNSATDTDTLTPQVDLAITKTDGATDEVPGTPVTYTIAVSNSGPSNAPGSTVADTFPASLSGCNWTCTGAGGGTCTANGSGNINDTANLPASGSVTYTATCNIDPAATGTLVNTATVTAPAGVTDTNNANNSATDTDTLSPETDLRITKTANEDVVQGGDTLIYTLEIEQLGPSNATNVVVTDTLPAAVDLVSAPGCVEAPDDVLTCNLGNVAANAVVPDIVITVVVNSPPPPTFSNTATIDGTETDPVPSNSSSTAMTTTDILPPTVVLVDSQQSTADGELTSCENTSAQITQLSVRFSEELQASGGVPGPNDADNPANYLLVGTGADLDFSTLDCMATGDDVPVPIDSVTYQVDTPADPQSTTIVNVNGGAPLSDGLYRLVVCNVRDLVGNELNGNPSTTGTEPYVLDQFRIETGNLLQNSHFDCDLAGWQQDPAGSFMHNSADVDNSLPSGSALVPGSGATPFRLQQCVPALTLTPPYQFGGSIRNSTAGVTLGVEFKCQFFAGPGCTGALLHEVSRGAVMTGSGDVWIEFASELFQLPMAASSARCSFALNSAQGASFSGFLDQLFLDGQETMFEDGFESGDVSAWSGQN